MKAGKPKDQSLAIAYSTQRHNRKKKMALGGAVEGANHSSPTTRPIPATPEKKPNDKRLPDSETMSKKWSEGTPPPRKPDDRRPPKEQYMADHFAEGGEVTPSDMMDDDERADSIADAIMRKRRMADGGMVDLNEASEEEGRSPYDEANAETGDKEAYDLDQLSAQPMGSNRHGNAREDATSDAHDMVSRIRAKIKAKRGA